MARSRLSRVYIEPVQRKFARIGISNLIYVRVEFTGDAYNLIGLGWIKCGAVLIRIRIAFTWIKRKSIHVQFKYL